MPAPRRTFLHSLSRLLLLLAAAAALCPPARAALLDELDQALAELRHPRHGSGAFVANLDLPLAAGSLHWERGRCRMIPLRIGDDSLFVIELSGRGRLRLAFPDSLDGISALAALGRRFGDKRLRRATLVMDRRPADWGDLAWRPLKPFLPFLRVSSVLGRERLGRLDPDNPLLGAGTLWLMTDPDEWVWREREGSFLLSRPLHAGSSVLVPVAGALPPPRQQGIDSLALRVTAQGSFLVWDLELSGHSRGPLLYLLLDPRAELTTVEWRGDSEARPARSSRALQDLESSPWLAVETPERERGTLRLSGRGARSLAVVEAPGRRRAGRANWFPRPPLAEDAAPLRLEDPDHLFPAAMTAGLADGGTVLLPEERPPVPLGAAALLCWTPLRQQAGFHVPEPARVRHFTPDIANLDLPREREVRTPGHESPAEPVDLGQGADTLSQGILGEEEVLAGLAAAAVRLEAWLGAPPRPVLLLERQGRPERREEEDGLLAHELPPEKPLEIEARELRAATPEARLGRLEMLCRGWWLPGSPAGEEAPRWIRWGAARACALLLLEDTQGAATARALRRKALEREMDLFTPNAFSSRQALGERAEGSWRSAATQERLAWRFALLLENLRWRLRDPRSLEDGLYRQFLAELRARLVEPAERGALDELKAAVADFLVANERLEAAGFADAPALWSWLEAEFNRWELPTLRVTTGQVETAEGPRLALRTAWQASPAPSTVLPVLAHTADGYSAFSLGVAGPQEQFVLPLDPAQLLGLEVAPGGSLLARVHVQ